MMNGNLARVGNPKSPQNEPTTIWQWNCRSYRSKKHSLSLFASQHTPTVIALQETETDEIQLRGYQTYTEDSKARTAILIQANQTAQTHSLPTSLDYTLVELIPPRKTRGSLFILNIYSPPSAPLGEIDFLFKTVKQRTKGHALVIVGDFNAHHTTWGYPRDNKKGQQLYEAIRKHIAYSTCMQRH